MCGPLRDAEVKLGGSDDAEAQREAAEADVGKHWSDCECGLQHRDVCHTVTIKAAEPGFPTPRTEAGLGEQGGALPGLRAARMDGDCGVVGHAAPDRMKANPVTCGPLRGADDQHGCGGRLPRATHGGRVRREVRRIDMLGKGAAEAQRETAASEDCKLGSASECGPKSRAVAGPAGRGASPDLRAAREGGDGCGDVGYAAPDCMQAGPVVCGPLREADVRQGRGARLPRDTHVCRVRREERRAEMLIGGNGVAEALHHAPACESGPQSRAVRHAVPIQAAEPGSPRPARRPGSTCGVAPRRTSGQLRTAGKAVAMVMRRRIASRRGPSSAGRGGKPTTTLAAGLGFPA